MISIIIPCFNGSEVICQAIESCYRQGVDEQDFEIIVVDDHSDQPVNLQVDDRSNVTCIRNSMNLGPAASRNEGIKVSKGEFIAFLDSDDLMINGRLGKQLAFLNENNLDFVISAIRERGIGGTEKDIVFEIPENKNELTTHIFLDKIYSITPTIFFKKSILEETGLMDESLRHFEDKDFLLRVVKKRSIGYIDEPLLLRRVFATGISRSVDEDKFMRSRKQFYEKAIELYPFLEYNKGKFWAIQFRGFGKLSLQANQPKLALSYLLRSFRANPNLKSVIYLASVFLPPLRIPLLKK
ncbi:glycosyltransferase family 2 protein [Ekhidna sp. To15]|uniref:glycosyltransferase family 2 protein n=1 Tax=Ekhidna sp. To15 TaxID=3395267 RepID=UPI003F51DD8D